MRARARALDDVPDARSFVVASAEDTILAIVGMLKTGEERLDYAHLARWAGSLGVGDLRGRARQECSLDG